MYIVSSDYMKNIHQERDSVVLVNCVEYLGIVNMRKYVNRSVYSFRLKALKTVDFTHYTTMHDEPPHVKTNKIICAPIEDSHQPHEESLGP